MQPGPQPPEQPGSGQPYGWPPPPPSYPGQPAGSPPGYPGQPVSPYPGSAPGYGSQGPGPAPGHAPYPYPQPGGYGPFPPPYGYGPPPQPSGGGKKAALITLVVLVTLGLLTAGGFGLHALLADDESDAEPGSSAAGSEYAKLGDPHDISTDDLEQVDRRKLFLETLRTMMLQDPVRTKGITLASDNADLSDATERRIDIGFNYEPKEFSYDRAITLSSKFGGLKGSKLEERCVDGKQYTFNRSNEQWRESSFGQCEVRSLLSDVGDGINIFGLNEQQADAALEYFSGDLADVIDVTELGLKSGPGDQKKQYLRFVVDYTPTVSGQYGYLGLQHFVFALQRTGIEPPEHPYITKGSGAQGLHMVYYVDPATGLPVYSQHSNIAPLDEDGAPLSVEESKLGYREDRYEYYFDDELPTFDMGSNDEISLEWDRDSDADSDAGRRPSRS